MFVAHTEFDVWMMTWSVRTSSLSCENHTTLGEPKNGAARGQPTMRALPHSECCRKFRRPLNALSITFSHLTCMQTFKSYNVLHLIEDVPEVNHPEFSTSRCKWHDEIKNSGVVIARREAYFLSCSNDTLVPHLRCHSHCIHKRLRQALLASDSLNVWTHEDVLTSQVQGNADKISIFRWNEGVGGSVDEVLHSKMGKVQTFQQK